MIRKWIKRLLGIKPKKQELNNTRLKWDNEYSFHPAGQNDQNTVE